MRVVCLPLVQNFENNYFNTIRNVGIFKIIKLNFLNTN